MTAYLLCGPSLSGKSALATCLARELGARILSADAVNAERGLPFGGEGHPESVWAETLEILLERLSRLLREGHDAVVDDTLCYRWLRDRYQGACEKAGARAVLLVLSPPSPELIRRRESASHSGSRPVLSLERLRDHLARFEWPAEEECPIDVTETAALALFLQQERERRSISNQDGGSEWHGRARTSPLSSP